MLPERSKRKACTGSRLRMPRVHGCPINSFHAQTWLKWFDFTVHGDKLDCNCRNMPMTMKGSALPTPTQFVKTNLSNLLCVCPTSKNNTSILQNGVLSNAHNNHTRNHIVY